MKYTRILGLLFISLFALVVQADDFVPEDEEQTAADVFILGSTDSGSNITLQFGSVLGEFLQWDAANGRFSLSGDLDLAASQLVNTRLENLPTAPTCDGAAAGRVYFDTTSSSAFVCDGTTWIDLGGQSAASATQDLATARYRDTSTTNLNATATDNIVPWNTEDFENPKFTHDEVTNNSQIQVTDSGKYLVSGSVNVINTSTNNFRYNGRLKFRINGITTLPQTFQPGYIRRNSGQEETSLVFSTVLDLNAGDFFEVLVDRENTTVGPANMISGSSSLSVIQLQAVGAVSAPFVGNTNEVPPSVTQTISIIGANFLPTTTVSIPGFAGTVNSTSVVSPTQIDLNITTTAATGTFDVVVDNDGTDNSLWAGNGVGAFVVALIGGTGVAGTYTESFETDFGSWANADAQQNWARDTAGTPSGNTGPTGASAGTTFVYTEASTNGVGFPNRTFAIETEDFATPQSISFDYHMFGADMGDLEVQTQYQGVWTTRFTLNGQQQAVQADPYLNQFIDLSLFPVEKIRFFYTSGGNFTGDCAIDNVVIIST